MMFSGSLVLRLNSSGSSVLKRKCKGRQCPQRNICDLKSEINPSGWASFGFAYCQNHGPNKLNGYALWLMETGSWFTRCDLWAIKPNAALIKENQVKRVRRRLHWRKIYKGETFKFKTFETKECLKILLTSFVNQNGNFINVKLKAFLLKY